MRDHLVLFINGHRHELGYDDAAITLSEFLRNRRRLVGTKVVCNEGDCGACTVLVGRQQSDGKGLKYETIDACITFVYQLDRAHVVTVEGLGQPHQLTPIQAALVQCHGSQCGFCTPGIVVAMHGLIESESEFDDLTLRDGLSGNLCRCTGYQQIFDAGKTVAPQTVAKMNHRFPSGPVIDSFDLLGDDPVKIAGQNRIFIPKTIEQACQWKSSNPSTVVVGGATDIGVLHNHGRQAPQDVMYLGQVAEFDHISVDQQALSISGGATWTQIANHVHHLFPPYHQIIRRFGSPQIRNSGTLAGNLATGSPIADSIPFHLVMGSDVHLASVRGLRVVPLNDFYTGYRENVLADDELIVRITTPLLAADERLALFKISKRRDMDISTLTLALWIRVTDESIQQARLAIGGVGPTVTRISPAEDHLTGGPISLEQFQRAGEIAREHIAPWSDVRGSEKYRLQLAENLLVKAYHQIAGQRSLVS